jgi:NTE family protein
VTAGGVGMALGGGGPVGVAWEIGVVVGLAEAAAFQANRASVIVGTSAGSIVGTLIRQGRAPKGLIAWLDRVGPPPPPEPDMRVLGAVLELMAGDGPPTERELRRVAQLALSARTQPVEPFADAIGTSLGGREWPPGDLRITAVDCDSCQLRVWTAANGIGVDRAVTSSIAVPGVTAPVPFDGRRYMDGGMRSPSSADVLAGTGVRRAIFIGPMAGRVAMNPRLDALLDRERAVLAAEGVPMFVIAPGDDFRPLAADLMNPARQNEAREVGLADGRAAAAGLQAFLQAP